MAGPKTSPELAELARKSNLIDRARLDAYLQQLQAARHVPPEAAALAGLMVRDGLLTRFQAEQLLLGKWKRFTLGRYKILERLGVGGMGSVYLCEHQMMRRRVAIKVLSANATGNSSAQERFYREARAVAALDHPNIVHAYDIDQDGTLHYFVMEYVDGTSLHDLVKQHGPLSVPRACHYVRQAAQGMDHAHTKAGLVHRDIKPGNLLLDRKGVVKILDLGLARFLHDQADDLTRRHDESVLGTADYLAPEQTVDSHAADIRADIYGLGCTFYFLLAGHPPYPEGSIVQKLMWHKSKMPTPIRQLRPEVPEGVAAVLEKMLAKKPADRHQTPAEVVAALDPWTRAPLPPPPAHEMPRLSAAVLAGGPLAGPPPVPPPRSSKSKAP